MLSAAGNQAAQALARIPYESNLIEQDLRLKLMKIALF